MPTEEKKPDVTKLFHMEQNLGAVRRSVEEQPEDDRVIPPGERRTRPGDSRLVSANAREMLSLVILAGLLRHCHVGHDEAKAISEELVEGLLK